MLKSDHLLRVIGALVEMRLIPVLAKALICIGSTPEASRTIRPVPSSLFVLDAKARNFGTRSISTLGAISSKRIPSTPAMVASSACSGVSTSTIIFAVYGAVALILLTA